MTDAKKRLQADGPPPPLDYRDVFFAFDQGFCVLEVLLDDASRPRDYRFLEVNQAFEHLTGLARPVGRTALELIPTIERHWIDTYGRVALTGESVRFVQGSEAMGRWFDVHASRIGAPELRRVALLFNDISAHHREQEERKRAEEALRASEHRFRDLADTAPAILWVTEADGRCSYLSRGWYEFTGQTAGDALGYGWLAAVHPGDRADAEEQFTAANVERRPFALEHRVRRADGEYRWVIDGGRPRIGSGGSFEGFVGSVIDIHDRRVAEDRLDFAVRSGDVGLWYCDLPFDTLEWDAQVKAHFGLPADAVVTIEAFFGGLHPDDREPTQAAIERSIGDGQPFDAQYRTIGPDGRQRWVRAKGRAQYDGDRAVRFDGITIDVTELVRLREAAEAASRAKDEFLAMLGHELRNPLAPILTALQLLKLRGIDGIQRESAVIERQVQHLIELVDDLLDVSRITRGKIDLRTDQLDIADIMARAIEMTSPLLEQQRHRLQLRVPRGLLVTGDERRLAQVVQNLLANAAKYTPAEGIVTIEAYDEADAVVLTVRDTGVGIDVDMLPRIFDSFVQQPQTLARSQGGLGLGLTIVRSLVELHGGSISVQVRGADSGRSFPFVSPAMSALRRVPGRPPLNPCAARRSPVSGCSWSTTTKTRRLFWGRCLNVSAIEVRVAYDGLSALAAADTFEPQLALIDIGLPVMDGLEVARRLASNPRLARTRLIAVTGYGQERDRDASARAGFSAHIVKPVNADSLQAVISSVMAS